jgi:tetratricopeptide (TPR) repeat protein
MLFGTGRIETLRVQRDLSVALRSLGRLDEAEALLRATLGSLSASEEEGSPFALETAAERGYVLFLLARYDEAIDLLRSTLERQRATFGERYAPAMLTARYLGSSLRDRGRLDEAEVLYRQTLRITQDLYGEQHEQTAYSKIVLSILLERQGELEEAERLSRQSLAIMQSIQFRPVELIRLGGILLDRGDVVEAERLLDSGLVALRRIQPKGGADEADALNRLAYLRLLRHAPDAARAYAEAAAFDRARSPGAPDFVSDGVHFLAWAHQRRGDSAAAEAAYRRALALYRIQLPPNHAYTLAAQRGLAELTAR